MKFATLLTTTVLGLNVLLSSGPALAKVSKQGSESSGGGNTHDHVLIERYAVSNPLKEIPELKLALEELKSKLEKKVPDFAKDIEENVGQHVWYIIPTYFNELSQDITGLSFKTEQPVYQLDDEVFISRPGFFEDMKGQRQERIALMKHELIMLMAPDKSPSKVRKIFNMIENEETSALELANTLEAWKFPEYLTAFEKVELGGYRAHIEAISQCLKTDPKEVREDKIRAIEFYNKELERKYYRGNGGGNETTMAAWSEYRSLERLLFNKGYRCSVGSL